MKNIPFRENTLAKRKKAQQIVEFLLIAPFIIGFLAFFTEFAFALNINFTITKSLKEAVSKLYQYSQPNMTQSDITDFVKQNFITSLDDNGIPVKEKNNINVGYIKTDNIGIFMAKYTYYPAFTLPSIFFNIMPEKFNFMTTVPVPLALLKNNDYSGSVTSETLDSIWSAGTFSSYDAFDGIKHGILNNKTGRNRILFLFPTNEFNENNTYLILNWDGSPVSSNESYYTVFSKDKSNLLECSAFSKNCSDSNISLYNYIINNNKSYIYVVNKAFVNDISINSSNIKSYWLYDTSGNPIDADKTENLDNFVYQGILKNTIALIDAKTSKALGNYDNLSCYNPNVCDSYSITIHPFGSIIFIDDSNTIKNKVTYNKPIPDYSSFGG